jgi:hypothetical protein
MAEPIISDVEEILSTWRILRCTVDELVLRDPIAERAIACKGWRWMSGMRVIYDFNRAVGDRFVYFDDAYANLVVDDLGASAPQAVVWVRKRLEKFHRDCLPDFGDPATLGWLIHLVRFASEGQLTICGEDQLRPEWLVSSLEYHSNKQE